MQAVLRRSRGAPLRGRLVVGELAVDPAAREVTLAGAPVALSPKELAMLQMLAVYPTRVVTKQELLRDVWGFPGTVATRTIDVHAYRLRRKLGGRFVCSVRERGTGRWGRLRCRFVTATERRRARSSRWGRCRRRCSGARRPGLCRTESHWGLR